jgi:hypothetical protein
MIPMTIVTLSISRDSLDWKASPAPFVLRMQLQQAFFHRRAPRTQGRQLAAGLRLTVIDRLCVHRIVFGELPRLRLWLRLWLLLLLLLRVVLRDHSAIHATVATI